MDYGSITPEGMQFLLREMYHLNSTYFKGEDADDFYPGENLLFIDSQFPDRKQTGNLLESMNPGEQIVITDRLFISWIFACADEGYWLLGPFRLLPVSTSMLDQALGSVGQKDFSAAAFREYHSQMPQVDGDRLHSLINVFLQFTTESSEAAITWLNLYELQDDGPAEPMEHRSYIQTAFNMEAEYMESVFLGNTQGALNALGKIQDRYKGQQIPASGQQGFSIYGNAVCCTMARIAAFQAGVSPMVLSDLFQKYMELSVYSGASSEQFRHVYAMTTIICEHVQKSRTSQFSPLVRKAVCHILENYTQEIRLDKTAEIMAVNSSYLSASFSRETGCSFTHYLNRIRLEKAAMDLRCSSLPIGRIAENVGISDQNYFAKIFRREYGKSPSEYRHG